MGIRASYQQIDDTTLDALLALEPDDVPDGVEELQERGAPTLDLDKAWDGLHFLLTGVSAAAPVEGDRLSEAVVGVHVIFSDDDEFIGCTERDELAAIIAALEAVALPQLLESADFGAFDRADVYPDIWSDDPRVLTAELGDAFRILLEFLRASAAAGQHVVVSIY